MLDFLIALALRRRAVVLAAAVVFCTLGGMRVAHARLDVLPDFAPPQVAVQTEAPGRTAQQVELQVTRPVESAVQGAPGVAAVRSESIHGLSIVRIVFDEHEDPVRCRQAVAELLIPVAAELPDGVAPPRLTPLMSATMDLLKIGLRSQQLGLGELRDLAQWRLRPHLLAVPGVAGVSVFGGDVRRLEVAVRPERLAATGIPFAQVLDAVRLASSVRGAGFVEDGAQRIMVQADFAATTANELRHAVVAGGVALQDVADVAETVAPKFGDCLIQGEPGVLLTMTSQYGANTLEVTYAVERVLAEFRPELDAAGVTLLPRLHRPGTFVERALGNLRNSLGIGAGLVALVLLLFLRNLRTAVVSLVAIPLSLLGALVLLDRFGFALDTMALGGLAMATGEVVDDAIVDVENVVRRLRENRLAAAPRSAFAVVLGASVEVRGAVVFATAVVAIMFVPVITMSGLAGRLFEPLGLAYLAAIGASLLVALLITPALCLVLLRHERLGPEVVARSTRWFDAAAARLLPHHAGLTVALVLVAGGALWLLRGMPGEFVPAFREGHFVVQASLAPGTALDEMRRVGARLSRDMLAMPWVATVEQQIGRVELGEDPWGPERSEFHVELRPLPGAEEAVAEAALRELLETQPGVQGEVLTFLGDRISETITGETADVVVTLTGEDLDVLDQAASRVAAQLRGLPGAVDVLFGATAGAPVLAIAPRRQAMRAAGIGAGEVLDVIQAACQGIVVATVSTDERPLDVCVVLHDDAPDVPERLARLPVRGSDGALRRLGDIASLTQGNDRAEVLHEAGRRRQVVTCNVAGRSLDEFTAAAREALAPLASQPGLHVHLGGLAEERGAAGSSLRDRSLLAGLGAVFVLLLALGSVRLVLLMLLNLPFAFVGGVVALRLVGHGLDMGALVGFVTLFGITARNALMLLAHLARLVRVDGLPWHADTVRRAVRERVRPILMTAMVTGLALLPIAIGREEAGREIEGPMAIVILGGLVSSTVLTLLVLPSFVLRYARLPRKTSDEAGAPPS
ncbi:MAG TPA: efflux RND transporter permease subunit [Planctomycetota bacterium]|nr:efflux RND transporter permease subunit [Planctomycetota bacterium]